MRATKIKGAVSCQLCTEILDPEDHTLDDIVEATWQCPECNAVTDTGETTIEQLACSHDPPEVLREQCPECEAWVEPQEYLPRKQCPSCQEWFEAGGDMEYEETEAWKCGECDTVYGDRDEAKECCH